jgi:hypothetical protein
MFNVLRNHYTLVYNRRTLSTGSHTNLPHLKSIIITIRNFKNQGNLTRVEEGCDLKPDLCFESFGHHLKISRASMRFL